MQQENSIDVLNKLIEINNDRIEGYETATKETDETDLKNLFAGFIQASQKCRTELSDEVIKLGGTPTKGTRATGKLFRMWMDLKVALSTNDRRTVINSCEFGEDEAKKTYDEVIRNDFDILTPEQQTMIRTQYSIIKNGHDRVRNLRDSLQQALR